MKISSKAIRERIAEHENQIKDLQEKIKGLNYTLEEFVKKDSSQQKKRPNVQAEKGSHPRAVKDILRLYPEGLTAKEIATRLQSQMNYRIDMPTLSSVLNRDKERNFVKAGMVGRSYRYTLRPLEAVNQ